MSKITIIGAGAWGTALAQSVAGSGGGAVTLWARDQALAAAINATHMNARYLPGITLHPALQATHALEAACTGADVVVPVVPAQHLRAVLTQAGEFITPGTPLVICAKGIELGSGKLMTQVASETVPQALLAVLSGPNFAHEIARGLPAAATLACPAPEKIRGAHALLAGPAFRLYINDDVIGTQIGGAVKNVVAIVCGIVTGRKIGENARAAVVTRGLHEMGRLAQALGGRRETLMGLSGIGDLILTASSMRSRNFSLGVALGEGNRLEDILAGRLGVTEGVATAEALVTLARVHKIDMPIVTALHACLTKGVEIDSAIRSLMERPHQMEGA